MTGFLSVVTHQVVGQDIQWNSWHIRHSSPILDLTSSYLSLLSFGKHSPRVCSVSNSAQPPGIQMTKDRSYPWGTQISERQENHNYPRKISAELETGTETVVGETSPNLRGSCKVFGRRGWSWMRVSQTIQLAQDTTRGRTGIKSMWSHSWHLLGTSVIPLIC